MGKNAPLAACIAAACIATACGKVEPDVVVSVQASGTGTGMITSSPDGISCGTTCTGTFAHGTTVTLTAVADADSSFDGWDGMCAGTNPCTITAASEMNLVPMFGCLPGSADFTYTGSIVMFTVPGCVTSLTIDAAGGQGGLAGPNAGGLGAEIIGTIAVNGGDQLQILVGGAGVASVVLRQQGGGTGGGGTYVTTLANEPLVIAGGGGGACYVTNSGSCSQVGIGGSGDNDGLAGTGGTMPGGTNGGGGTSSNWNGWNGGSGGGGLLGDGINLTGGGAGFGTPNAPGSAFVNGGLGGVAGTSVNARNGAFGGGGAAGFTGGGGGGYSGGGAGGSSVGGGGGGGSYNASANPTNTAAVHEGSGAVSITY